MALFGVTPLIRRLQKLGFSASDAALISTGVAPGGGGGGLSATQVDQMIADSITANNTDNPHISPSDAQNLIDIAIGRLNLGSDAYAAAGQTLIFDGQKFVPADFPPPGP